MAITIGSHIEQNVLFFQVESCRTTDGDVAAIFLTENFPLITPGTPCCRPPQVARCWPATCAASPSPGRTWRCSARRGRDRCASRGSNAMDPPLSRAAAMRQNGCSIVGNRSSRGGESNGTEDQGLTSCLWQWRIISRCPDCLLNSGFAQSPKPRL
jgi:hypothetical protein